MKKVPKDENDRSWRSVQSRWGTIHHDIIKLVGCYADADEALESGKSEEDLMRDALGLFYKEDKDGRTFNFVECWKVVKEMPKFQHNRIRNARQGREDERGQDDASPNQQKTSNGTSDHDSSASPFSGEIRPQGNKKAKREASREKLVSTISSQLESQKKIQEEQARIQKEALEIQNKRQVMLEFICNAILQHIQRGDVGHHHNSDYSSQFGGCSFHGSPMVAPPPPPMAAPPPHSMGASPPTPFCDYSTPSRGSPRVCAISSDGKAFDFDFHGGRSGEQSRGSLDIGSSSSFGHGRYDPQCIDLTVLPQDEPHGLRLSLGT